MPMRARMSLIMGQIKFEHPELFALEFGKIAESDFVYTLASTNIDHSTANLVKMYVTIRSWMSSIMDLNRTRTVWVIYPWIGKFAIFDFVYTLASANIDQSVANLATIYIPIKSQISLIMGQIKLEHPELFALENWEKLLNRLWSNALVSTNIDQSAPNLVKMYMTIRSRMSLIMDLIGLEQFELFALELENLTYLTMFTL